MNGIAQRPGGLLITFSPSAVQWLAALVFASLAMLPLVALARGVWNAAIAALVPVCLLLLLIRKWHAELNFDRATGTLAITERPTLGLQPAQRVIPLTDIAFVDVQLSFWRTTGYVALRRSNGEMIFRRRLYYSGWTRRYYKARAEAMQTFLNGAG